MTVVPALDAAVRRLMELDQESVFALVDIAQERIRQIDKEGWTPAHDDEHRRGEIDRAAAVYAYAGSLEPGQKVVLETSDIIQRLWPWDWSWLKAGSPHRNRVKSGALLVAAMARHLRTASKQSA